MLSNDEAARNLEQADKEKTASKTRDVTQALDLMRERAGLAEQLAAIDHQVCTVLTRLRTLMDLAEFAQLAHLTKADVAPWAEMFQTPRSKPVRASAASAVERAPDHQSGAKDRRRTPVSVVPDQQADVLAVRASAP